MSSERLIHNEDFRNLENKKSEKTIVVKSLPVNAPHDQMVFVEDDRCLYIRIRNEWMCLGSMDGNQ